MTATTLQVTNRSLLYIMALPLLLGLAAVIDHVFLDAAMRRAIAAQPYSIAYWFGLLSLPHVVASLNTFADREYATHYKPYLMRGAIIALTLGIILPLALGSWTVILAMAFYSVYHNYMHQFGVSLMMLRQKPTFDFQVMRWATVIGASLGFIPILMPQEPLVRDNYAAIITVASLLLLASFIFAFRLFRTVLRNPDHTRIGIVYLASNLVMTVVAYVMLLTGYGLLAVVIVRLVHDYSSFWVYMVHDQNRNAATIHNPIYYLPKKLHIPPVAACLPIALLMTFCLLKIAPNQMVVAMIVSVLSFMHYYIEGYIWKRGSLHRQHTPLGIG